MYNLSIIQQLKVAANNPVEKGRIKKEYGLNETEFQILLSISNGEFKDISEKYAATEYENMRLRMRNRVLATQSFLLSIGLLCAMFAGIYMVSHYCIK